MIKDQNQYNSGISTTQIDCVCDYCGAEFRRSKRSLQVGRAVIAKESCGGACTVRKREESTLFTHGVKNAGGTQQSLQKAKQTWLSKYGVESPMHVPSIVDKVAATQKERYGDFYLATDECREKAKYAALERHGVESFMQSEEVKDKVKSTNVERYGATTFTATPAGKAKVAETVRDRYGVDSVFQSQEIRDRITETMVSKYGAPHALQVPEFLDKAKKTCEDRHGKPSYSQTEAYLIRRERTCLERYGVTSPLQCPSVMSRVMSTRLERYGTTAPQTGASEQEVRAWLEQISGESFAPDTSVLGNSELDCYSPAKKIAVEFCGLHWHNELSPQPRTRSYHYNKHLRCTQAGIRLITIFEDEWVARKTVCQSILASAVGKYNSRLFARDCEVKSVGRKEFNKFCDESHLQGSTSTGCIFYVLIGPTGEPVAGMSFGRHHRQSHLTTLDRLWFKPFTQVVGGASRLFKMCLTDAKRSGKKEIITWSDNRWSEGKIYPTLGFTFDADLPPDYSYVNDKFRGQRFSKQSQKKSATGCPPDVTEREWAIQHGFHRIWDCGKKRWRFDITQT